jgi:hypothetical protein
MAHGTVGVVELHPCGRVPSWQSLSCGRSITQVASGPAMPARICRLLRASLNTALQFRRLWLDCFAQGSRWCSVTLDFISSLRLSALSPPSGEPCHRWDGAVGQPSRSSPSGLTR